MCQPSSRNALRFCSHNAYTECMFSWPQSAHPSVRTACRLRQSVIMPRRPWAALAMIVLWTAAPAVAAACGVHCQTVKLHACCQQRDASMPNMPMPNMPTPHRRMTNPPMPASCGAFGLQEAAFSATVSRENLSVSAFARIAAPGSSAAVSSPPTSTDVSLSAALASISRLANRTVLGPAASGVSLRI